MSEETIAAAVAKKSDLSSGGKVIDHYRGHFAQVLPTHINPDTWVRVAQGALRKGQVINAPNARDPMHPWHGRFLLEFAAMNNRGAFLSTLLDAARLGLSPGTEHYYLTPRRVKENWEILGIVGYQGYIELMYRSGRVRSVVAELVHEKDAYRYIRGRDRMPLHEFPSFGSHSARGPIIGTYAYALLENDAVSRVIELSMDDIAAIEQRSPSASAKSSPWKTDRPAMILKSAVRPLRKWVPTSPEWMNQLMASQAAAQAIIDGEGLPPMPDSDDGAIDGEVVDDPTGGASLDDPAVEGDTGWPDTAKPPA